MKKYRTVLSEKIVGRLVLDNRPAMLAIEELRAESYERGLYDARAAVQRLIAAHDAKRELEDTTELEGDEADAERVVEEWSSTDGDGIDDGREPERDEARQPLPGFGDLPPVDTSAVDRDDRLRSMMASELATGMDDTHLYGPGGLSSGGIFGAEPVATNLHDPAAMQRGTSLAAHRATIAAAQATERAALAHIAAAEATKELAERQLRALPPKAEDE